MRKIVESRKTKVERQMARIFKSISVFALCSLFFVPSFAQEAFYIYRNDGDFNGFFYDEVVEMRYSKITLDSVEHEQYVTYEVQLADTVYRIPLSAIDSIGFQQPEIKFSSKVHFVDKEGLCQYLLQAGINGKNSVMLFQDIPEKKLPKVGDVWIGLPDDACSDMYANIGGSFSCVVTQVNKEGMGQTRIWGHTVDKLEDVFEQYITVEEIGIDENNQIHRRVAGCTPDGMPRHIQQKEGQGEITVIDFNSTISHSWKMPADSTEVDLSADLNLKLRVRASYNIQWYRMIVKITPDILVKVKPSLGLSVKKEFKKTLSDIIPLPDGIPFPAAAPIFELCPMPTLFLNASGKLEGRINMPQVGLGVGMDIVIDSWGIPFPVMGYVHLAEDEEDEVSNNFLDFSAEMKLSGTIYTGAEFQLAVNTNRWFKDILEAGIGMHFTAGPKEEAQISFNTSMTADEQAYYLLSSGSLTHTWLSLGFNAGAKAKIGWDDPDEVTFLEANKDLFQTTLRLAPLFNGTTVDVLDEHAVIELHPQPCYSLLYQDISIGVYKYVQKGTPTQLVTMCSDHWHTPDLTKQDKFYSTLRLDTMRSAVYLACPVVDGPGGPFVVSGARARLEVPTKFKLEQDSMLLPGIGGEASLIFTCNHPLEEINFYHNNNKFESYSIEEIGKWRYKLTCVAWPNQKLFATPVIEQTDVQGPYIWVTSINGEKEKFHFKIVQEQGNLSGWRVNDVYSSFGVNYDGRNDTQTFTRLTKDVIEVNCSRSYTDSSLECEYSLTLTILNTSENFNDGKEHYEVSGSVSSYVKAYNVNGFSEDTRTMSFVDVPGTELTASGQPATGTKDYVKYSNGVIETEEHITYTTEGSTVTIKLNRP